MTTKQEMIDFLKLENPTLRYGDDEQGYTELSKEEYEAVINDWADARLAKELKKAEAEAQAQAKADLLKRLGITEAEAKLLLA